MMDVMIVCVVTAEHLEWVEGKTIATVIVDRFHSAECKQEDGLPDGKIGDRLRYHSTNTVEKKPLEGVIVEGTERIGYIEPVVHGMEVFVEELVCVHPAVKEILPSVDNKSMGS